MNYLDKSVQVIKEFQDESGAYIASPNFSQYKYCWFRDGAFIADVMNSVGEKGSASRFFEWGLNVILKNKEKIERIISKKLEEIVLEDFLPTRYQKDGSSDTGKWTDEQTDGYGIFLWAFERFLNGEMNENEKSGVEYITGYLQKIWKLPCYDVWEESSDDIHTSTLLSIAAGLKAAEKLLERKTGWESVVKFIRENHTENNRLIKSSSNHGVDGSLIWCISPFELFTSESDLTRNTCEKIYKDLCIEGGVKRYLEDSYFGGGSWILLSCYLGKYYKDIGDYEKSEFIMNWVEKNFDENGYLAEQTPQNLLNPESYKPWVEKWGKIASPLLWSHAAYIYFKKS